MKQKQVTITVYVPYDMYGQLQREENMSAVVRQALAEYYERQDSEASEAERVAG